MATLAETESGIKKGVTRGSVRYVPKLWNLSSIIPLRRVCQPRELLIVLDLVNAQSIFEVLFCLVATAHARSNFSGSCTLVTLSRCSAMLFVDINLLNYFSDWEGGRHQARIYPRSAFAYRRASERQGPGEAFPCRSLPEWEV